MFTVIFTWQYDVAPIWSFFDGIESEAQGTPANHSVANDQGEDKPTGEKLKCCMSMNNFIAPTGS